MDGWWVCECLNEWCLAQTYSVMDGRRPDRSDCPMCGWTALPGSGIRRADTADVVLFGVKGG